jgi:enoyl-CoA hydratase/carnithine racemase
MKYKDIILSKKNHIATITFNRPHVLNALTDEMLDEIRASLKEVRDDNDIRVVILTGAGKAFTTSIDLKVGKGQIGKRLFPDLTPDEVIAHHQPHKITQAIYTMEKPTIAMVNGVAVGNGFDWCLACDIRIGSDQARFRNSFIKMGLYPVTGGAWLYPRVMGLGKALEYLYSARWMDANEAYRLGVLNTVVPADKLEEETMTLAKEIAEGPPASIRMMKSLAYKSFDIDLETALDISAFNQIKMIGSKDHIEAVSAWLEKRQPKFNDE